MNQPSPVEFEVQRMGELMNDHRFADVLRAADALVLTAPENPDVLYLRAVAQRRLGDISAALATLAGLERMHPRFSRLYQERGHCFVALRQAPAGDRGLRARREPQSRLAGQLEHARGAVPHDRAG